jgi:hypothetical protein
MSAGFCSTAPLLGCDIAAWGRPAEASTEPTESKSRARELWEPESSARITELESTIALAG